MKIEKGKLYYDTYHKEFILGQNVDIHDVVNISNKIAVHCPTKEDWEYVRSKGYDLFLYDPPYNKEPYFCLGGDGFIYLTASFAENWRTISISKFKEFYPETSDTSIKSEENVHNNVQDKVVTQVTEKYQERSKLGIEKYNTTLEDNKDGLLTFLNHLQEELMDATLYIQKLKNQVEELKGKL